MHQFLLTCRLSLAATTVEGAPVIVCLGQESNVSLKDSAVFLLIIGRLNQVVLRKTQYRGLSRMNELNSA